MKVTSLGAGLGLLSAACSPLRDALTSTVPATALGAHPTPTAASHPPTVEVIATHGPSGAASTPGVWSGRVVDNGGVPLAQARITLVGAEGGFFREARTDAGGRYVVPDAPAGSFSLGASAPGYDYQEAPGAVGGLDFVLGPETQAGRWSVIGNTEPEAFGGTNSGVLMPNGKIIYCHDTHRPVVFDPITGNKELPAASPSIQGCHMVSHLPDGRVFYVGGGLVDDGRNFNNVAVNTVKAFDPETLTWEVLPSLTEKRWYPGLARLADGRYLVFGGGGQPERLRVATCEIYDPQTRQWTPTGPLTAPGGFGPCQLLLTGEVLVAWFPPQLYDVTAGRWRNTGLFTQALRGEKGLGLPPTPADHPDFSTLLLDDGRVAAIGARSTAGPMMVEFYDPAAGQWSFGTNPEVVRSMPEVLRLPTGKILVAAGKNESGAHGDFTNEFGYTRLVDLYDPVTGAWQRMSDLLNPREYHAITLLAPDGRVVVTGGPAQPGLQPPPAATKDIEAFEPPYLFRGPRPRIESLSKTRFVSGGSFTFDVSFTAGLTSVVLIGVNAITHWMDGGVPRRLSLRFSQTDSTVRADVPGDPVQAMPGFYLLFALVDDIPSEGVIVQIE